MKIEFVPLEEKHIATLAVWLQEPHVRQFWQETEDIEKLREKFLNLPKRGVQPVIVRINGEDVAYFQSYEACKVGGGWWSDAKPGVFGVDQFIGVPSMVNRGIGTEIIKQFTARVFREHGAAEIITDPDPKNARAIRAYEKVGFFAVGEIKTPNGAAMLMKLVRPRDF